MSQGWHANEDRFKTFSRGWRVKSKRDEGSQADLVKATEEFKEEKKKVKEKEETQILKKKKIF